MSGVVEGGRPRRFGEKQGVLDLGFPLEPTKAVGGVKAGDAFMLPDETSGRIIDQLFICSDAKRLRLVERMVGMMGDGVNFFIIHGREFGPALRGIGEGRRGFFLAEADLSGWSQDRVHALLSGAYSLFALIPGSIGTEGVVATPKRFTADYEIPDILQRCFPGHFVRISGDERNIGLPNFEGGDVCADDKTVFVGGLTVRVAAVHAERFYRSRTDELLYQDMGEKYAGVDDPFGRMYKGFGSRKVFASYEDVVRAALRRNPGLDHRMFRIVMDGGTAFIVYGNDMVAGPEPFTRKDPDDPTSCNFIAMPHWVGGPTQEGIDDRYRFLNRLRIERGDTTLQELVECHERQVQLLGYLEGDLSDTPALVEVKKEVVGKISRIGGNRRVELVGLNMPHYHLDLFMKPVGDNLVVVGDAGATLEMIDSATSGIDDNVLLARHLVLEAKAEGDDVVRKLDLVVGELAERGYKVYRVPHLASPKVKDNSPCYSYCNVEIERYKDEGRDVRKVYMPVYGPNLLDDAAEKAWRGLGFDVVKVDMREFLFDQGSFRCAEKVVKRRYD